MTVPVAYDRIIDSCADEDAGAAGEVERVADALEAMGLCAVPFPVDLGLSKPELLELGPRFVFNCVDSLDESGRYAHLLPAVLDDLGVPYTGAGADAVYLTSNKVLAKRFMAAHGVRTPAWHPLAEAQGAGVAADRPFILKHVWEDASIGLDARSVVYCQDDLDARIAGLSPGRAGDLFLEEYVDGREFNVSVIAGAGAPRVLPPMELEFRQYPAGRPKIVDYAVKWLAASPAEAYVARRFDFPADAEPLLGELRAIALRCWELFHLTGYARVDFRVDAAGTPWVLEINTNPYMGHDSSFLAAAARAGLSFADVVRLIVEDVERRADLAPRPAVR